MNVGDLRLDPAAREASLDKLQLDLTSVEFALLETLLREAGHVVTREQLTETVLGRKLGPFDRVIDVHISNLRKKLGRANGEERIKSVDLTELVSQIIRSADFELQERDGAVRLSSQGQYFVQGNAELLHSAIENVIRNAIRYTGAGNSVDVQLESMATGEAALVRILVRDYGQGVPESELVNIFQPFYRVADDRNRESGGTGLGLAIADRVVRIHGGTIKAQNAAPQGLQVEMLLPRAETINSPRS